MNYQKKLNEIMEHELVKVPGIENKKVPVIENPSTSQIKKLMAKTENIGGILYKDSLYLWNRDLLDHETVESHYVLPNTGFKSDKNPIPFYIMKNADWTLMLSPSSWMGVDHKKDIMKIKKSHPLFKGLRVNDKYFEN